MDIHEGMHLSIIAAIAAVLIYGVNDVFRKKALTWAAAVVIPITLYMLLPAK